MKTIIFKIILLATFPLLSGMYLPGGDPVYPVKVSENGRYFADQNGAPVFWLGTTQWQLFRDYKLEEARTILEKTRDKGFCFVQVILSRLLSHSLRKS